LAFFGEKSSSHFTSYGEVSNNGAVSEKYQFVHINDASCANSHGLSDGNGLLIFRKFDSSPVTYTGAWNANDIVDWLYASSLPTLIEFSEDYIEPIFGQKKNALFLFRDPSDANSDFSKVFSNAASELKGKIVFVVSGVSEGI